MHRSCLGQEVGGAGFAPGAILVSRFKNNVSRLYTGVQADAIADAALDAGDAIDAALAAPTKQETVYYWQKIFGSTFQI